MANDDWVEVPVYLTVGSGEPFLIGTATGPRGRSWSVADTVDFLEAMARAFRREQFEHVSEESTP